MYNRLGSGSSGQNIQDLALDPNVLDPTYAWIQIQIRISPRSKNRSHAHSIQKWRLRNTDNQIPIQNPYPHVKNLAIPRHQHTAIKIIT